MRSILKRWEWFIVIAAVVWMAGAVQFVNAEEVSDVRPIDINQGVDDSLGDAYDQKYYQVTLVQNGCLTVKFSNPKQGKDRTYWEVDLLDDAYHELCGRRLYGNYEYHELPAMGLPAGTYYIKVTPDNYYSADMYTLNAGFQASDVWEMETNDNFLNASDMTLNTDYYGTLCDTYDTDYYKIQLQEDGCLRLRFSHPQQGRESMYWNVRLLNGAYHELCARRLYGNYEAHELPAMGLPAGTYYIKVTSDNYYSADTYTMNAGFESSVVWEKELNDEFLYASDAVLDTIYYGTSLDEYDDDYYKIQIPADGYYRITFQTSLQDRDAVYWTVYLYNTTYQQLEEMRINGNYKTHSMGRYCQAGTYYVKVDAGNYYSHDTYLFFVAKWNPELTKIKESRLQINKISSGKKYLTVQFDTADVANVKYQVSYKVAGGKWKIRTVKSTSVKIKKLKSGKYYSVRVRCLKKIDGKTYYGKWSEIRGITVK